jgi:hypothetical protein
MRNFLAWSDPNPEQSFRILIRVRMRIRNPEFLDIKNYTIYSFIFLKGIKYVANYINISLEGFKKLEEPCFSLFSTKIDIFILGLVVGSVPEPDAELRIRNYLECRIWTRNKYFADHNTDVCTVLEDDNYSFLFSLTIYIYIYIYTNTRLTVHCQ